MVVVVAAQCAISHNPGRLHRRLCAASITAPQTTSRMDDSATTVSSIFYFMLFMMPRSSLMPKDNLLSLSLLVLSCPPAMGLADVEGQQTADVQLLYMSLVDLNRCLSGPWAKETIARGLETFTV